MKKQSEVRLYYSTQNDQEKNAGSERNFAQKLKTTHERPVSRCLRWRQHGKSLQAL